MSFKRFLVLAAASGALASCNTAYTHIGDDAVGLGEAVKYDAAIETINPAPVYTAQDAQPGANGERGTKAVEHYRKGQVKDVQTMTTTSGAGGGGGSL